MGWMDLHMHSNISNDGEFTPKQLMELCFKEGLKVVALADHNSIKGVKEAATYASEFDIKLIPAIELDCSFQNVDLHVLGYGVDVNCVEFEKIESSIIEQEQIASIKRLDCIKEMGIYFDYDKVMKLSINGVVTGEMIAEVALCDVRNEDNPTMKPFYPGGDRSDNPYVNFYWDFCSKDKIAYVPIKYLTLSQAIHYISSAGGISVLAHPGNNVKEDENLLRDIVKEGMNGIEVYSSYHSMKQVEFYAKQAAKLNLIKTLGSDFHGKTKPSVKLGQICGDYSEVEIYLKLISEIETLV